MAVHPEARATHSPVPTRNKPSPHPRATRGLSLTLTVEYVNLRDGLKALRGFHLGAST
ncbi:hypothetical protein ACIO13_21370 [Streptomyces sp. NPDC087425]|uniref:hypothetical protein n=1 Tax=Streptomyces sp. NPDC087425 TaxID=3365787 RepID=UPI003810E04D